MEKFKKGDRVISASGARGVVDEAFGDGKYAVLFDGRSTPDRVEEHRLRLANARAVNSTRPIVQRALNASNSSSDILAYVRRAPYAQSVSKTGNTIHYTSTDFRREDKDRIRRKVEDYLSKRANPAACYFEFGPDADPDDIHDFETFLRVDIPLSAVRNSSVAANAAGWENFKVGQQIYYKDGPFQSLGTIMSITRKEGKGRVYTVRDYTTNRPVEIVHDDIAYATNSAAVRNANENMKVRVVTETETLIGKRREEKTMTIGELRAAMTRIGHGRLFADVMRDVEAGKEANPLLKLPCEAWVALA